jgi:hypothetical protein
VPSARLLVGHRRLVDRKRLDLRHVRVIAAVPAVPGRAPPASAPTASRPSRPSSRRAQNQRGAARRGAARRGAAGTGCWRGPSPCPGGPSR